MTFFLSLRKLIKEVKAIGAAVLHSYTVRPTIETNELSNFDLVIKVFAHSEFAGDPENPRNGADTTYV